MKKIKTGLKTIFLSTAVATGFVLVSCGGGKYEIDFNVNGGSSLEKTEYSSGEEFTLPQNLTKKDYVFLGWYDNPDFTGDAITKTTASKNMTFYAKWGRKLNLNLNGATLDFDSLNVAVGANLNEVLAAATPTYGSAKFAGWYLNGKKITETDTMPDCETTIEAVFTQKYKVESYLNKVGSTTEFESEPFLTEEFEGEVGKVQIVKTDCEYGALSTSVTQTGTITVSANESDNVLKLYYQRGLVSVTFHSNYPDESDEDTITSSYEYNQKLSFPRNFSYDGYEIIGWAASPSGRILYKDYSLTKRTYGSSSNTEIEDSYLGNATELYAVWAKASTDLFGGNDEIYLITEDSSYIYLKRDGVIFEGKYNAKNQSFTFENDDDIILKGKLLDNGKFVYSSIGRQDLAFNQFSSTNGVNENVTILFDSYNGIRYSKPDESGALASSSGTYTIDENNIYAATFTDGEFAGKTIHFIVGYYNNKPVFQERNDDEYNLGDIPVYSYTNGKFEFSNLTIRLNGFGYAAAGSTTYYSVYSDGLLSLYNSNRANVGAFKLETIDDLNVFVPYSSSYDVEITNNNSKLTLDGTYNASYFDGTNTYEGKYSTESTSLGLYIVNFTSNDGEATFKFMVSSASVDEDGETKTVNTFSLINNLYKEFYYQDAETTYYAPLLVIEDETHMSLYGFVSKGKFAKISSGVYTYDKKTNKYNFTVVGDLADTAADAVTSPYDLKTIKEIEFTTDSASSYSVTKWYSYKTLEEEVNLVTIYTFSNSNTASLTILANSAVYFDGTNSYDATYSESNGYLTLTYNETTEYFYLDGGVLTPCELPESYYEYSNGSINKNEYFYKDRFGNLTYNVVSDDDVKQYTGTSTKLTNFSNEFTELLKKYNESQSASNSSYTEFTEDVYQFTYTDETGAHNFIYCLIPLNNGSYYFAKYNENNQGSYKVSADGYSIKTLALDGFGYYSILVVGSSTYYPGLYQINEEDNNTYVTFNISSSTAYYFDYLDVEKKTCSFRGFEAGTYLVFDNQHSDYYVVFDGYKNASVYRLSTGDLVDDNAKYTADVSGNVYQLTFTDGNKEYVFSGGLFVRTISNQKYNTFVVTSKTSGLKFKFVNEEDNSVYDFDEYGNATVYTGDGSIENGTYQVITDDLVYYVNSDSSDAYTLVYDDQTVVKQKYSLHGYYTSDFESLVFFQYGFALENASTRYYYQEIGDNVILYSYDPLNENANDYGYVSFDFGGYYDEITYNGKTYYNNDGYAINFERLNKEEYPIKGTKTDSDGTTTEVNYYFDSLTFAPTGQEFKVNGIISYNNQNISCTVTRYLDDDNQPKMTVKVGYIELDIEAEFHGLGIDDEATSTYKIVAMRQVREFAHSSYLSLLQFYYMFTGNANVNNIYGSVDLIIEYDINGNVSKSYLNSDFTDKCNITDSNGNLLNLDHADYQNNSTGSVLRASTVGSDGYTYNFYFSETQITSPKSLYGVNVIVTRTQELTTQDGYTLKTEQIVSYLGSNTTKDSKYVGTLYSFELFYNDEKIESSGLLSDVNGDLYLLHREYDDDKKITATAYYKIVVNEKSDVESIYAKIYDGCTVTKYEANTYYTEDGKTYVDIVGNRLMEVIVDGSFVSYYNPSYDSETDTYYYEVMTDSTTQKYSVKIVDGKVVISLVETKTSTKE